MMVNFVLPVFYDNFERNKKTENNNCWRGYGKTATLLHCWGEYKLWKPLWKIAQQFLIRLNKKLPYN